MDLQELGKITNSLNIAYSRLKHIEEEIDTLSIQTEIDVQIDPEGLRIRLTIGRISKDKTILINRHFNMGGFKYESSKPKPTDYNKELIFFTYKFQ